jgi:hypothetical protein
VRVNPASTAGNTDDAQIANCCADLVSCASWSEEADAGVRAATFSRGVGLLFAAALAMFGFA